MEGRVGAVPKSLVSHMRRCSKAILNCGGRGGGSVGAENGICPNPNRRTPDHPPYSEMVSVALQALTEENSSTESSISAYIQSNFNDLPWGHDRLLPYYLRKLVVEGELTSPSPDRYQLAFHPPPSGSLSIRRGRPRLQPTNPNPSFSCLPSAPPCHRGRSQPCRRRGRPPKIHAEDTPLTPLEQGTPRRGRGRPQIRRDASIGRTATRGLGLRLSKSKGSKRIHDSFPISDNEELNCQSGNSAFFNDIKNGGFECGVLENSKHFELAHAKLEQGKPFGAPEHYEHVEGQPLQGEEPPFVALEKTEFEQDQSLLGENPPLLTPEQGKRLPFLAPELFEHDQSQLMQEEAPLFIHPEQAVLVQGPLSPRERLPFFTTEPGNVQPFLAPELLEHDHGQGNTQPFVAQEQTELCQDKSSPRERPSFLTPMPGKMSPFLAPEVFVLDQGQPPQGKAPSFKLAEQIDLFHNHSIEGPPLLTSEKHEHDHGLPLIAPEVSEDDHGQMLPGVGIANSVGTELTPMLRPDGEEVVNAAGPSKKRKLHGRRRSLRLWFES